MSKWMWLWWFLSAASVVWYSSVTVYVTIRGAADIKDMLRHLSELQNESPGSE